LTTIYHRSAYIAWIYYLSNVRITTFFDRLNAAVEQCPGGAICLELLVLPAAERRGGSGVRCSTAAFSPSGARGER